jgi:hypothetical protein
MFSFSDCFDWIILFTLPNLGSNETNSPHLSFFHKESTDVAPLRFKSAMYLSNLFLYKATFKVQNIVDGRCFQNNFFIIFVL